MLLAAAAVTLVFVSLTAVPQPVLAGTVSTLLTSMPEFLHGLWQALADLLVLLALVLFLGAAVRGRRSLVRDIVLAVGLAVVIWLIVGRVVVGSWPEVWEALRSAEPPPWYPSPRVAIPGAAVLTASPHLGRPMRRVGRWLLCLAAVGAVALGATTSMGAFAGVLVAAIAAAAVHLIFGSCGGRPGLEDVRQALAEIGVETGRLGAADRQQAGLFLVNAEDESGDPLVVKVYGRDAQDAALFNTLWRKLWYQQAGAPVRLGRRQQVEHEAFLTLLAGQAGVLADTVVTAGATAQDDALLVLRPLGPSLADRTGETGDEGAVLGVWPLLRALQLAGIAHGQVDDQHLVPVSGQLGIRGFGGATVGVSATGRNIDVVQALVTTVLIVGEQVAISAARVELGDGGLAAALPYLQPAVLTPRQRQLVGAADLDLDALRAAAAMATESPPPTLQRLRRVTVGSVVRVVLPAIAVVVLISGLAGLDLSVLREELRQASVSLVIAGMVLAQTPRVTQAVSTLGASPVPLALGPVYALQLAVSYLNIVIPTAAARIMVNIRFFQRHGVPPGSALAVGALDGFSGFVVQATLLVGLLLFTPASLDLELDSGSIGTGARVLGFVVLAAMAAIVAVLVVPRWRTFVLGWVKRLAGEAGDAIRGLHSPRRIGMLVGGSLATELLFALSLGTLTRAFGYPVGLGELLLINVAVSLLAGLLPIPGGIGVTEGGLTVGLVAAGLPEEVAFAAVLLYRLATFYLPPIWGYFALRWLEQNEHL